MHFSLNILALLAALALLVSASPLPAPGDDCSEHDCPTTPSSVTLTSFVPVMDDEYNGPFTDGIATYYYQNGNAGACGWYNSDNAIICAMDQARFGTAGPGSPLCGKQVQITNMNNNWSVNVTIADDCPTCKNKDSIDLSVAAFQRLQPDLSVGEFPISWSFL